jgi:hypothetical protein
MINDVVTDGLFFGISAKLPKDCQNDTFCKFAVKLFGENTHLEFLSVIKKTQVRIAGRFVKRPEGSNKDKFRLSKIELFMEVSKLVGIEIKPLCEQSQNFTLNSTYLEGQNIQRTP